MSAKKINITKKYSSKELAESFVFRSNLTSAEKTDSDNALNALRKKVKSEMSEGQRIQMQLLSLKYQMEDWAKTPIYDIDKSFGSFVRMYAKTIRRKNYELANDLGLDETRFSQIINNHVLPNEKLVYRFELHSDNLIPASVWLDIIQKDIENEIKSDLITRKSEYTHVKNRISFSDKIQMVDCKISDVTYKINQLKEMVANEPKQNYNKRKGKSTKKK
jgi:hypothetical protein